VPFQRRHVQVELSTLLGDPRASLQVLGRVLLGAESAQHVIAVTLELREEWDTRRGAEKQTQDVRARFEGRGRRARGEGRHLRINDMKSIASTELMRRFAPRNIRRRHTLDEPFSYRDNQPFCSNRSAQNRAFF